MDKEALSKLVSEIREAWETTIQELGPEGLEQSGLTEGWRVRDVLAHFNGWDRWQLVQLQCAFTGATPTDEELTGGIEYPPNDDLVEDAMNAMFVAGSQKLPLDDILAHWRENSAMRAEWVAAASPDQLEEVIGADWTGGTNRFFRLASEVPTVTSQEQVWERIADQVKHQAEHLEIVRDWMRTGHLLS